jgi:outer membrane receptor protein involved in Fe transport
MNLPATTPHSQIRRLFALALIAAAAVGVRAQQTAAPGPVTTAGDATALAKKKALAAAVAATDAEVVEMSPFQVSAEADHGYLATSTLSGTRLNTKLDEIPASISVVTKEQLLDTAAVDINDIFKYEVNTEGTSQFTNFSVDRGNVSDGVQNDPQGSTRMRGLTSANSAVDGITAKLPFDSYNIDAVEISRGPNSTVFGLGNTGGGVNIIRSKANLTRGITRFSTRGDSYEGYRGTFDFNRPIVKGRLAIRLMGLYEEKGYVRKPSQDTTRRFQIDVAGRPFSRTTIDASFESYRNFNNRPNSLTPRDTITDWINSGKPTWDPINQTVHFGNGAPVISGVTAALEATLLPYGLAVSDTAFQTVPSAYVERDGKVGLFMISRTPNATTAGPTNATGTLRLLQNGNYFARNSTLLPLYNVAQITNKSLYDWTSVNLVAPNFAQTRGETSNIQLEQSIYRSSRQTIALQANWRREKIYTYDRRFLGSGAISLAPFVDVNETLLDGTPNPYFLRTYIGGSAPSFKKSSSDTENYRATLAYQLDLTHNEGWTRWFGKHNLTGYGEYRTNHNAGLGYQDTISSTSPWMLAGTATTPVSRNSSAYRVYPRYYVGDATAQNIDYAPTRTSAPPYNYTLRYLNGVTNQWTNDNVTFDEYYDANRPNKALLSTYGGAWQAFFLHDRIIPIFGIRKDYSRTRDSNSAINPTAATNGYYDTSPLGTYSANDWVQNRGKTTNEGVVVRPLTWLGLTYSQSNSFSPGSQTFDVLGNPLADPFGKTKDYGFVLSLFSGKLEIIAKQYETADIGRSTSDLNTIVQRVLRMDRRTSSGDPGLTDFLQAQLLVANPTWTDTQILTETKRLTGVDPDFIRSHINKTHGDASNSYSTGKELEIAYNPTKFWRLKFTGSQSNPLNGILSPAVQQYIESRMSTWTSVKDPVTGGDWWTLRASNGTIARDFYINNVVAPLKLAVALQGKRRTQTREYHASFLTNYQLAGLTQNPWLKNLSIGGSLRWEDKASIGFGGAKADADGIVREFDPNKPYWDKAHYYTDVSAAYRLKLFKDKVSCRLQLNVNNVFEDGRLQKLSVNPDGSAWAFRIVDPRQFILSATFDL